jgi:ribosomal protein S18 acetylase RimI-like enzyme
MTNRHISLVQQDDIHAIDLLVNSAYRGDSARKGWTHEADLLNGSRVDADIIAQLVADPKITLLKYTEDDQIIGCVCLEKKDDHVYLGMLTVNPDLQAKGIGKALLEAAESYVPVLGCNTIEMTVITVREELIAWYIRRGYRNTGKIKAFPTGDTRFGVTVAPLEFVVLEKQL